MEEKSLPSTPKKVPPTSQEPNYVGFHSPAMRVPVPPATPQSVRIKAMRIPNTAGSRLFIDTPVKSTGTPTKSLETDSFGFGINSPALRVPVEHSPFSKKLGFPVNVGSTPLKPRMIGGTPAMRIPTSVKRNFESLSADNEVDSDDDNERSRSPTRSNNTTFRDRLVLEVTKPPGSEIAKNFEKLNVKGKEDTGEIETKEEVEDLNDENREENAMEIDEPQLDVSDELNKQNAEDTKAPNLRSPTKKKALKKTILAVKTTRSLVKDERSVRASPRKSRTTTSNVNKSTSSTIKPPMVGKRGVTKSPLKKSTNKSTAKVLKPPAADTQTQSIVTRSKQRMQQSTESIAEKTTEAYRARVKERLEAKEKLEKKKLETKSAVSKRKSSKSQIEDVPAKNLRKRP
ncbi:hypothetical protein HK098_004943 [Nowakowskiella sp. JEL0407]|nr:hypothetical protein HK098_004943 [Nowakowskiella sp. JEL0407]